LKVAKKSGFFSTFFVHPCLFMRSGDLVPVILEWLLKAVFEEQERSKRVRADQSGMRTAVDSESLGCWFDSNAVYA
jgi:hypothetical protein